MTNDPHATGSRAAKDQREEVRLAILAFFSGDDEPLRRFIRGLEPAPSEEYWRGFEAGVGFEADKHE